jgi:hypothetical protein
VEGKANHINFRRRNISGPGDAGGGTSWSGVDNRLLISGTDMPVFSTVIICGFVIREN